MLKYEEERKLKSLEQQVSSWLKSRDIRSFVEAIKHNFARAGKKLKRAAN